MQRLGPAGLSGIGGGVEPARRVLPRLSSIPGRGQRREAREMEMRGAEGPPRACAADGSSTSAAAAAAIAFMRDASDASSPNIYCTGSEN
jgi:hypothetical protein